MALVIEDVSRTLWGAEGLPFSIPDWLNSPISQFLFFITRYRVLVMIITLVATLALYMIQRFTRVGIRIRAGTRDLETVSAMGVNIYGLRAFNFALGCLF